MKYSLYPKDRYIPVSLNRGFTVCYYEDMKPRWSGLRNWRFADSASFRCSNAQYVVQLGERVPAHMSSLSSDHGLKLRGPSKSNPRVALKCKLNLAESNLN
ncbi:hypothetical protein AVEN_134683-1 [Araneus ventricosus]|uniref:Uncharacterized protein n=1 Tax=Araneus ventricosus TaxID=182803 RepID=A0A4Y2LNB3_ARAVE|nr:hypothetical protein AVEN_134683-1 [Araneus ventricosus]